MLPLNLWYKSPNPNTQMFLGSSCRCLCQIYQSQVLSPEWRCRWSSTDRQCSNYIWVINNFITYQGASYITGLTVYHFIGQLDIIVVSCRQELRKRNRSQVRLTHGLLYENKPCSNFTMSLLISEVLWNLIFGFYQSNISCSWNSRQNLAVKYDTISAFVNTKLLWWWPMDLKINVNGFDP